MFKGTQLDPSITPYHYVRNNPLFYNDPDGEKERVTITFIFENGERMTISRTDESKTFLKSYQGASTIARDPVTKWGYNDREVNAVVDFREENPFQNSTASTSHDLVEGGYSFKQTAQLSKFIGVTDLNLTGGINFTADFGQGQEERKGSADVKSMDVGSMFDMFTNRSAGDFKKLDQVADQMQKGLQAAGNIGDLLQTLNNQGKQNDVSSAPQSLKDGDTVCCKYGNTHILGQNGVLELGNRGGHSEDSNYHERNNE